MTFIRSGLALGLPRPLHLKAGTTALLPWLPEGAGQVLPYDPPVEVLDPSALGYAAPVNDQAPLTAVVLLRSGQCVAACVREGAVGDALHVLMSDAAAFHPDHSRLVAELVTVLSRTPIFVVERGTPSSTASAIQALAHGLRPT